MIQTRSLLLPHENVVAAMHSQPGALRSVYSCFFDNQVSENTTSSYYNHLPGTPSAALSDGTGNLHNFTISSQHFTRLTLTIPNLVPIPKNFIRMDMFTWLLTASIKNSLPFNLLTLLCTNTTSFTIVVVATTEIAVTSSNAFARYPKGCRLSNTLITMLTCRNDSHSQRFQGLLGYAEIGYICKFHTPISVLDMSN